MSTALHVSVNLGGADATLASIHSALQNMAPALQEIGAEFAERTRQQFSQGQSPAGQPWRPLSAVTQAMRHGRRAGGQPLLDTGRLRASIGAAVQPDGRSVSISTNVPYAAIHQYGGQAGRGRKVRIPARPYLPLYAAGVALPDAWLQSAQDILSDHILQGGHA